jgi:hypothetical protein
VAGLRQAVWQVVHHGADRGLPRLLSRYRPYLGPGEKATIMVVAADRKQARQVLRFVRGLLSAPVLAKWVVNDVSDSIELVGDAVIEVITASHAVRRRPQSPP